MRARSLVAVTVVFAIAACSDVSSPTATGAGGPVPEFSDVANVGGRSLQDQGQRSDGADDRGARGHDDRDEGTCPDNDWRKDGHDDAHDGHNDAQGEKRGHAKDDREQAACGGGTTTATISGIVSIGTSGASGYAVYLLNASGSPVIASTTTGTDGSYSFAGVQAGSYLVCEADPFVAVLGYLAEATPSSGGSCPSGYAARGYSLTVPAGGNVSGNNFVNLALS